MDDENNGSYLVEFFLNVIRERRRDKRKVNEYEYKGSKNGKKRLKHI